MSEKYAHLPLRQGIGICLFNKEGKVFVGKRIDTVGGWQMPQGGVDEGETVEQTVFRELMEETGTDKAEIIRIADKPIEYGIPDELIERLWGGCAYKGQRQTWVALRFTGNDSDIHIDADGTPEFSEWEWVEPKETIQRIVPFKVSLYEQVIELFADIPQQL